MLYLIQYDLNDEAQMLERCKSLGAWMKYFDQSIIVDTNLSPREIYDRLSVDYEDTRFLIMELNKSRYYGFLPTDAWDWLEER